MTEPQSAFARDQWYVAAWSSEVAGAPLGRVICGEPIVVFRDSDGSVIALEDACPHRLLPLSMGIVEGGAIRCRYHGLLLDRHGRCLEMPGNAPLNPAVRAAEYAVVERYGFLWIWIGEADRADPALLPDLWMNEHPEWRVAGGTYHVRCDYRLLIDNLMDLTHETLVHASTIGQKELHEAPIRTTSGGGRVTTSRWMPSVPPPPLYRRLLGSYDGLVDRWQICEFLPPSGVLIDVGVAPVDANCTLQSHDAGFRSFILDFITPETATTTHYFWGSARNTDIHDDAAFDAVTKRQGEVFLEDVEVLEAQQRSIDRLPARKPVAFAVDLGGVRARLQLDKLIRAGMAAVPSETRRSPESGSDR